MERKVISLNKGIHRSPTSGANGELSECLNLIVKNGEIMNAPVSTEEDVTLPSGYTLRYIHQTTTGKNYILEKDNILTYMKEGEADIERTEVDTLTQQQKYGEYCGDINGAIKSVQEHINVLKDKINYGGNTDEEVKEAYNKLAECISLVEYSYNFLDYLKDYVTYKPSPNALNDWNKKANYEKFERLYSSSEEHIGDYLDDVLVNCYDKDNVWSVQCYYGFAKCTTTKGNIFICKMTDPDRTIQTKPGFARYKVDENYEVLFGGKLDTEDNVDMGLLSPNESIICDENGKIIFTPCYDWVYKGKRITEKIAKDRERIALCTDSYYEYYDIVKLNKPENIEQLKAQLAEAENRLLSLQEDYNQAYQEYLQWLREASIVVELCKGVVKSITNVGNVLAIATDEEFNTFMFSKGYYSMFNMPQLDMQFRLKSELESMVSEPNLTFGDNINEEEFSLTKSETKLMSVENSYWNGLEQWTVYKTEVINIGTQDKGKHLKFVVRHTGSSSMDRPMELNIGKKEGYTADGWYEATKQNNSWVFDFIVPYEFSSIVLRYEAKVKAEHSETQGYVVKYDMYVAENVERKRLENTSDNYTAFMGNLNKFIKTRSVDKDKFMYPFFVRYGIKMFDGTYMYPSAPILMQPNTGRVPVIIASSLNSDSDSVNEKGDMTMCAFSADLEYKVMNTKEEIERLYNLKELAKEIVIAVSAPIYSINLASEYEASNQQIYAQSVPLIEMFDNDYSLSYCPTLHDSNNTRRFPIATEMINVFEPNGANKDSYILFNAPKFSAEQEKKNFENASTFYIVKSIPVDELFTNGDFNSITLEKGTLEGLLGRERLTDNSISLTNYIPSNIFSYNKRLVIGNIKEYKFGGYNAGSISGNNYAEFLSFSKVDGEEKAIYTDDSDAFTLNTQYGVVVELLIDGEIKKVYKPLSGNYENTGISDIRYFYYPSSNAVRATIYRKRKGVTCTLTQNVAIDDIQSAVINLKEHPYLDGAYWFDNFNTLKYEGNYAGTSGDAAIAVGNAPIPLDPYIHTNKIIQTFANNPFAFDMGSAEYVGNGDIYALSTNAKAISQGQFGQYPLVCFTSDGIWSISIDSEGKWSAMQPITRDIMLEGTKPLQTDSSIVFACVDGIKMLSGSDVKDISSALMGENETVIDLNGVIENYNVDTDATRFEDTLNECEFVYDSANRCIRIFSHLDYHYILSLDTGEWSRAEGGKPDAIIAGYPYTYMQYGQKLNTYKSVIDSVTTRKGVLLTRELSFDNPICRKLLYDLRMIYKRRSTSVKVAVWVSNDRENWCRLHSMKKASYKWYRFAIFTNMTDVDGIEGIVCDVDEKFTNKIR